MARSAGRNEPPVLLVKWYDVTKWLLGRVDSFPKNQRFIFGQRIADRALNVLEVLVEAAYSHRKMDLLARANRDTHRLSYQPWQPVWNVGLRVVCTDEDLKSIIANAK